MIAGRRLHGARGVVWRPVSGGHYRKGQDMRRLIIPRSVFLCIPLCLAALAGCMVEPETPSRTDTPETGTPTTSAPTTASPDTASPATTPPRTEAACLAAGGRWGTGGIRHRALCFLPTPDAGKACTKATDCHGFCLAETGTCSAETPRFGCFARLDASGARRMLCVD